MTRADRRPIVALGVIALAAVPPVPAQAKVTRIESETVKPAPALPGAEPYEIVTGRFYGEIDPAAPGNALITDIPQAPRNARGMVEYSATFALARPVDPAKGSGVLFYDVPNRGNGGVSADPHGHVRVISGWQGDLPEGLGLQTLRAPVARLRNGKPLTGPVLARFVDMPAGTTTLPITGSIGLPTALAAPLSLDTRRARLLVQDRPGGRVRRLPASQWAFADCSQVPFPGKPDPAKLCLRGGFDPARAYNLVYTGKDPLVMGVGFAATRDLVAFLRHAGADDAGTPNPARTIRWAVASGTSQSGNYLKSFVNLGFNADEDGRIVFDGVNPNIAARQVPLNIRFAVPGGAARPGEAGSEGTLWWGRYNDTARGLGTTSLLDRCTQSGTCPKVIETFGSAELWGLRMSPGLVGTRADRDIPVPDGVRRYYFPSVTHGGSWSGGFPVRGDPVPPTCVLPGNPNPMMPELVMLRQRLVEWVSNDTAPPPSSYPLLARGDLVPAEGRAMGWPAIPGAPVPDGKLNRMVSQLFGPGFQRKDMSGVLQQLPPKLGKEVQLTVPRVDVDGNETVGVRSVQLMVPIGTYLGWNVVAAGFDKGAGCGFAGGFIPFAVTRAERLATGDPRLSLEERYGNHQGFVAKVRDAAQRHSAAGWISADDAARLVAQAEASQVLRVKDQ
ncbi:alpha/beta hydrolase domain-containing protein [Novosphingobium sp.]|uniref:alpha/beta hydrolase domain-containing protein n=1 Tax=Novosphingobium sp. TaxID=1874826 RepID=UPI0035ADCED8